MYNLYQNLGKIKDLNGKKKSRLLEWKEFYHQSKKKDFLNITQHPEEKKFDS